MKISNLKKLACITAIVLAPLIAFAGGTNSKSEAATGESRSLDSGLQEGDMGQVGVGQTSKQDTAVVDDATLIAEVQKALKDDPETSILDVTVKANKGVVTLTGVASAKRWKNRVTEVTRSVVGVHSVKNNMKMGSK
ncbi:MAG: BON domain-containing protein [Methylophilaceae bacterium]